MNFFHSVGLGDGRKRRSASPNAVCQYALSVCGGSEEAGVLQMTQRKGGEKTGGGVTFGRC